MSSRNKIIIALIIFMFALRAYDIRDPFSTNGVDEGIHLLQAHMMHDGYNYYDDLQGDQAPLALLTFSVLDGNVLACRWISYALFFISSLFLFLIAQKFGKDVAFMALLILCLDFTLLRESRLASLDLFSAALLCIASFFILTYMERHTMAPLALSSIFLSLSVLTKVIPVFLLLFFLFYLFFMRKDHRHGLLAMGVMCIPAAFLLLAFTPHQLIEGIILRQSHRGFDLYTKLSIVVFIASCFIYLYAIRKWNWKDTRIRYLLMWALLIFIPLMAQGRTLPHHFAFLSYPLAVLSAIAIHQGWNARKKAVLAAFVVINVALAVFFIATAPGDLSYEVADDIAALTDGGDLIISGNPLVTVLSHRTAPPNLTNVAKYHYPETTLGDVVYWLENNETKVIVLYYHLSEIDGLKEYLENSSQWHFYEKIEGRGQMLFYGFTPKFSRDSYEIYVKE